MVRIEKLGRAPMIVPKSAYENFFKNSGWTLSGSVGAESQVSDVSESVEDEWEELDQEYEKPLGEMDLEELRNKAAEMGLDVSGLTTPKQVRDKIRKNMG